MNIQKKHRLAHLRRLRVRTKVSGTPERPRMSVKFTGQHIYVQFIDDVAGKTLSAVSTIAKELKAQGALKANSDSAKKVGALAAQAAISVGLKKVVFDRRGAKFHGKVKALADAAREGGLEF
ncbi:MAG: 50S ribosomal protein L18 [Verrucomicrobiales bacterium]|nr:50S ribosomal protein L18 [Verrucomicrobiales bacterium]